MIFVLLIPIIQALHRNWARRIVRTLSGGDSDQDLLVQHEGFPATMARGGERKRSWLLEVRRQVVTWKIKICEWGVFSRRHATIHVAV